MALKCTGRKSPLKACWDGYEMRGMKKKGNRSVPNCVPKNSPAKMNGDRKLKKQVKKLVKKGAFSVSGGEVEEGPNWITPPQVKQSRKQRKKQEVNDAAMDYLKSIQNDSPVKKAEPRRTIGRGKNFNKVSKDKSATGGAAGGGMTEKGVREYKRKNPGSKLKTAVTKDPSKLKPGSKDAKRRKSFCARSKGWTGERGKAARRRWNC